VFSLATNENFSLANFSLRSRNPSGAMTPERRRSGPEEGLARVGKPPGPRSAGLRSSRHKALRERSAVHTCSLPNVTQKSFSIGARYVSSEMTTRDLAFRAGSRWPKSRTRTIVVIFRSVPYRDEDRHLGSMKIWISRQLSGDYGRAGRRLRSAGSTPPQRFGALHFKVLKGDHLIILNESRCKERRADRPIYCEYGARPPHLEQFAHGKTRPSMSDVPRHDEPGS